MALTAAEQAELEALKKDPSLAKVSFAPDNRPSNLSPQEQAEMARLQSELAAFKKTGEVPDKIIDYTGRTLDYPGGYVRVGLGAATGNYQEGDLGRAVVGKAPHMNEILDRTGVGKDPLFEMNLPGVGKVNPSTNDILGFGGDIALDPFTSAGKAASFLTRPMEAAAPVGRSAMAQKLFDYGVKTGQITDRALMGQGKNVVNAAGRVLNPVGEASEVAGRTMYNSGFKNIDKYLPDHIKPLSEVAWENGRIRGTSASIDDQITALKKALEKSRGGLYEEANSLGARVDPDKASAEARKFVDNIASDPYTSPKKIDSMNELIDRGANNSRIASPEDVGAQTPIERVQPQVQVVDLPMQGAEMLPIKKHGAKVETIDLPLGRVEPSGSSLMPQQNLSAGPAQVRTPGGFEPSGLVTLNQESSGPFQFIDQGGWQKAAPVQTKLIPLDEASALKTRLRRNIQGNSDIWGANPFFSDDGSQLNRALSHGYQTEIEHSANAVKSGLGDQIKGINQDLATIIEAQDPLERQVKRAATINAVTPVDMAIAASHPGAEVAKKAGDLGKTTWLRTKAGNFINRLGESGAMDPFVRRLLIGNDYDQNSPWSVMPVGQ